MTDGRRKGAKFENELCRLLSIWWFPDRHYDKAYISELPFRRRFTTSSPLSGEWEGKGDVLHNYEVVGFPFCVEAKNHKGWELDGAFYVKKWKIYQWWEQCEEQADKMGLLPLLIFTRNQRPIYAMYYKEIDGCLKERTENPALELTIGGRRLVVVLFSGLLVMPRKEVVKLTGAI